MQSRGVTRPMALQESQQSQQHEGDEEHRHEQQHSSTEEMLESHHRHTLWISLLSLPRGSLREQYGGWNRHIR